MDHIEFAEDNISNLSQNSKKEQSNTIKLTGKLLIQCFIVTN